MRVAALLVGTAGATTALVLGTLALAVGAVPAGSYLVVVLGALLGLIGAAWDEVNPPTAAGAMLLAALVGMLGSPVVFLVPALLLLLAATLALRSRGMLRPPYSSTRVG